MYQNQAILHSSIKISQLAIKDDDKKLKKQKLGQFFTCGNSWLQPQVLDFIKASSRSIAFDPFAGRGDMLLLMHSLGFKTYGLDIDNSLNFPQNDSLKSIPNIADSIIITNPPYIAKQSARRKGFNLDNYFKNSIYDDIYLIALHQCLCANNFVVAIVPESFINSNFAYKSRLYSISILEQNPFMDTENPVCVVCFDSIKKNYSDIKVYKNDIFIGDLATLLNARLEPKNNIKIIFNDKNGWLALRAVDSSNDIDFIGFDYKENIQYDWSKIKISSRHITLINIEINEKLKQKFILKANEILNKIRIDSNDILLTPFKGNTKLGTRRRRLDYKLARAILEKAYFEICGVEYDKYRLF